MAGKMKALQLWCQKKTTGYKDVNVVNMTTSWRDGLAFCALIHHYRPDLIDFDSLSKENVFQNNQLAFQTAENELSIPALLDAEDMVAMKVPDKLSIITYVSQYYNCLNKLKPQENPLKRSGSPKVPAQVEVKRKPVLSENVSKPTLTSAPVLSEKQQTISTCELCKKKVHLVERYIDEGKLFHRQCHRKKSLGGMYQRGHSLPYNNKTTHSPSRAPPPEKSNTFKETNNSAMEVSDSIGNFKATPPTEGKRPFSSVKQQKIPKASAEMKDRSPSFKENAAPVDAEKTPVSDNRRSKVLEMALAYDKSNKTNKPEITFEKPKLSHNDTVKPNNSVRSNTTASAIQKENQHNSQKTTTVTSKNESTSVSKTHKVDIADCKMQEVEKQPAESPSVPKVENSQNPEVTTPSVNAKATSNSTLPSNTDSEINKTDAAAHKSTETSGSDDNITDLNVKTNKDNSREYIDKSSDSETGDMLPSLLQSLTTAPKRRPITTSESSADADDISPCAIVPLISELSKGSSAKPRSTSGSTELTTNEVSKPPSAKPRIKSGLIDPLISEHRKPSAKPRSRGGSIEASVKKNSLQQPCTSAESDRSKPAVAANQYDHSLNPFGESDPASGSATSSDEHTTEQRNEFYDDNLNPFGDESSDDQVDEVSGTKPSSDALKVSLNPFGDDEEEEETVTAQPHIKTSPDAMRETKLRTQTVNITSPKDKRLNPFTEEYEEKKQLTAPMPPSRKKAHAPAPPKVVVKPSSGTATPPPSSEKRRSAPNWKSNVEKKMEEMNEMNKTDNKFIQKPSVTSNETPNSKPPHKSPSRRSNVPSTQKKQPKASRPAPGFGFPLVKRPVKSQMTEDEIVTEMEILDVQLKDLENKGVKLEEILRDEMELGAELKSESDQVLGEWFNLVHEKNILVRRETDLVFLMRQQRLEQEHADVEFKIRKLLNKPDAEKTDEEKEEESKLVEQLMEIVERRNTIINSIEEARLKEEEEDAAYDKMKMLQTDSPNDSDTIKKKKKIKMKKIFSKRKKSPKHQASSTDLPTSTSTTSHT